jgi:TatA/E family protein of Tat protein translocase
MPTPGPLELVIILVIALLILGPGKLPDVGAALGKSIREFRKASTDVQDAVKVDTSPLPAETPTTAGAAPAAAAVPAAAVDAAADAQATAAVAEPAQPPAAPVGSASVASKPASEPTAGSN